MIVGTAGHIDHGKSSLVKALTGVDPDRLKEEKARGITIELGFAYLKRKGAETIGFIDVPGHERLVHTMLAGASGIDVALLVVAADDGVMPQTREHLAIVDLLAIPRGVVALTKSDLADADRRTAVRSEIAALVAGTALEGAEVVEVSAVTGEGLDRLVAALDRAGSSLTRSRDAARLRLAVDRAFSIDGAGTVVTGTVLSGRVAVGDQVVVSPSGLEARVRSIHAQNASAAHGHAGQRCALALVGPKISPVAIARGDVVLDPTLHEPTRRIDAHIRLLAGERKALGSWLPVKLHCGAFERDARVLALAPGGKIAPGGSGYVQIRFEPPAALAAGDRLVLRDAAASRTIGGGVVLDLRPPERHRTTPARLAELDALARADTSAALAGLLDCERGFVDLTAFFRDRAAAASALDEAVAAEALVTFRAGNAVLGARGATWEAYAASAVRLLGEFHAANRDAPGLGHERLQLSLSPRLPEPAFAQVVARLVSEGRIVVDRSWLRLPEHEVRLSPADERAWARIRPLLGGTDRFRPPRVRDIANTQALDEALVRRLLKLAARRGAVEEIAQDHYFLNATVVEMADIARELAGASPDGDFAVSAFRDRLDNGRKVAIQVLEFFDRQGLTMRRGDIRRINPHKRQMFSRMAGSAPAYDRDGGEASPVGRPDFKSGEGRETALGGFDSCLLRQPSRRDR